VTCYFRHLQEVFKKAGIEAAGENKKELDEIIHSIVGTSYKNCPATWKEVKKLIAEDEEGFVSKLKAEWRKRA
jgi:molecular chaperone GrpE (heat shock protein)